jgi:hypothetical protein
MKSSKDRQWPKEYRLKEAMVDKISNTNSTEKHGKLRCHESVDSSCSTSCTHHVTLAKKLVISHEWRMNGIVIMISGIYTWSFVTYNTSVVNG